MVVREVAGGRCPGESAMIRRQEAISRSKPTGQNVGLVRLF